MIEGGSIVLKVKRGVWMGDSEMNNANLWLAAFILMRLCVAPYILAYYQVS